MCTVVCMWASLCHLLDFNGTHATGIDALPTRQPRENWDEMWARRKTIRYERNCESELRQKYSIKQRCTGLDTQRRRGKYIQNKRGAKRHGGIKGAEDVREDKKHSQHEVLLPAWLTASHSDGCALNILHLQGHVCVKFLCKKRKSKPH